MATIEDIMLSKDERTFQYENDLLSLPVPDLSNTLKKYLASVRPLVSAEEYRTTEAVVKRFAEEEGPYLHQRLTEFAEGKRNWIENWWEEQSYLGMRLPLPMMNMSGFAQQEDVWPARNGTQVPRAAAVLYYSLKFWEYTRKEMHRPAMDRRGRPLSMYMFKRIYNTVRLPGVDKDELIHYFKTEEEGDCPTHVIVMSKGHIFCLEMFGEDGELLTPPEIEVQLEKIKDKSIALGPAHGVPFLTSMGRSTWAETRSRLINLHPQNREISQTIQESIVALWLEDGTVSDESHHTVGEGIMMVSICTYIHKKLQETGGVWKGDRQIRSLPEPKHLQFVLDDELMLTIDKAKEDYAALYSVMILDFKRLERYNEPYNALYEILRLVPTYETAPTRQFYHGRTAAMRTCTKEVLDWCTAMDDPKIAHQQKMKLFVRAVTRHLTDFAEATELKDCDRHLLGLSLIAKKEGRSTPELYTDPSFSKSGGGGNYILVTSCLGYSSILGGVLPGAKHKNSIACFYKINDDKVTFFVSKWNEDVETTCSDFATAICSALDSMKELADLIDISSKGA
ncbi:peroxisomal carnitine o-octanoyltransferase [Plakobranchus ocellatus]|uniref:Peroxisomal carnitine o-octanoyltransferase n=1 Tax=Plakobranchus ocellatus TaxID=259542 RepID=A0AAV4CA62_9GAST|nr:peroxisomal carnitine o-octanoyltransferase [Plakobranchus ocellatus]